MNIRHKVAIEGCRDSESPNAISQRPPDIDVEDLTQGRALASCAGVAGFDWHQGLVGEASQHQYEHKDAQNAHGVLEAHFFQQTRQHEGQGDGEDAAAGRHNAIDQTQALLEVVAQDDQAGLVGERAATGKYNAIGEIQGAQGPVTGQNNKMHKDTALWLTADINICSMEDPSTRLSK